MTQVDQILATLRDLLQQGPPPSRGAIVVHAHKLFRESFELRGLPAGVSIPDSKRVDVCLSKLYSRGQIALALGRYSLPPPSPDEEPMRTIRPPEPTGSRPRRPVAKPAPPPPQPPPTPEAPPRPLSPAEIHLLRNLRKTTTVERFARGVMLTEGDAAIFWGAPGRGGDALAQPRQATGDALTHASALLAHGAETLEGIPELPPVELSRLQMLHQLLAARFGRK